MEIIANNTPLAQKRHVVYFDWFLNERLGGPPGYLWQLRHGLKRLNLLDGIDFVVQEGAAPAPSVSSTKYDHLKKFGPWVFRFFRTFFDEDFKKSWMNHIRFLRDTENIQLSQDQISRINFDQASSIHVHTVTDAVAVHNSLVKHGKRNNIKLILTSHCPEAPALEWSSDYFNRGLLLIWSKVFYFFHRRVDRIAFTVADEVIFPCEEAMEPYIQTMPEFKNILSQKKLTFVPTGVDPIIPTPAKDELVEKYGLSSKIVYSFIGRHNSVKGFDRLTKAGKKLLSNRDEAIIIVAGKNEPIKGLDHNRWIELGWYSEPANLLAASRAFILPNRRTYFDLIFLEVLSVGTPIIASATGGNLYFRGLSSGILFFDSDNELDQLLESVSSLPENKIEEMREANRRLHAEQFSLETFAAKYHQAISKR